jgi:PAS domain S-box-containing protein
MRKLTILKNWPVLLSGIIALLIFAGWQFHIPFFKRAFSSDADINPLTAICVLVASMGFLFKGRLRIPAGIFILGIAVAKLITWTSDIPFFPELWLYADQLGASRMSPNTAFNFLLVGTSLLFLRRVFIQYFGLVLLFIIVLNFLGYLYSIRAFYELAGSTPLPFYSALCFFLLSFQIFFKHPRKGFMRELTGQWTGSVIAKKILPITVGTSITLGILLQFSLRSPLRNDLEIAGIVFFLIVGSVITTWYMAVLLNRKAIADKVAVSVLRKTDQKEIADYKYALDESAIVAITDQKGIIQYVNENFCRITGYTARELVGNDHRLVNSGFHSSDFMRELWRTIANGNIWRGEIKNRRKDGGFYWVDTTIVPFLNEADKPYRYTAIRFDITERKNAQEELERVQANLMTIFDTTDIAFVLMDPAGKILSFNTRAVGFCNEYFGKQLVPGAEATYYFTKGRHNFIERVMDRAIKGTNTKYEVHYPQNDGRPRWFQVKWSGVKDETGSVLGLLLSIWDITENKSTQLEKGRITSDLIHRNKDLEQFTYIVSHNLRAPAANITGLLSLLKGNATTDAALVDALLTSSKVLDQIIHDLNTTLQITHHIDEKKEPVSLTDITRQVRRSLGELLAHNAVVINEQFNEDAVTIHTIRDYMYSIFYNLIQNSVKYRREEELPSITITSQQHKTHVHLNFKDNGKGIDLNKYSDRVFGLYKRFDFSTEGKGLGLFMVKTQVESLGGEISVKSEMGKGTEFLIKLPLN